MICTACGNPHLARLHPTSSYGMRWNWRRLRFEVTEQQSGDAVACWNCAQEFIITRRGETIQRTAARRAQPIVLPKREEPEPLPSMKDQDMAEAPEW